MKIKAGIKQVGASAVVLDLPTCAYCPDHSEIDQGAAGNGRSIKAYVDKIRSESGTILLTNKAGQDTTTYTLTTNETTPSTVKLEMEHGAVLDGAGTLTINGPFEHGLSQCFGSSITITFGSGAVKEVYPEWWGASPSASSAVNAVAIQAAFNAYKRIHIPEGIYNINAALVPGTDRIITGDGLGQTIIKNDGIGGVIMYAPHLRGSLDKIQIDGNNVAGSIGIQADDTHKPYGAEWGSIQIKNCKTYGIYFYISGATTIAYNSFRKIETNSCEVGMYLYTNGVTPQINANNFGVCHNVLVGTTGLHINNAQGNKWDFLSSEPASANTGTGIYVEKGAGNIIVGGWVEGHNVNINIADNPDVIGFEYWGSTDQAFTSYTYNFSNNRSILLSEDSTGKYKRLAGKWFFEHLQAKGVGYIQAPMIFGAGFYGKTYTTGTTPSVEDYNVIFLNYGAAEAITDFTDSLNNQIVLVIANNTNATIADAGNFLLSAAWNPATQGDSILLIDSVALGKWIEISRTSI